MRSLRFCEGVPLYDTVATGDLLHGCWHRWEPRCRLRHSHVIKRAVADPARSISSADNTHESELS